jgi:hypothetical protein
MDDQLLGTPRPEGLEKIEKAGCEMYLRCIVKAKVIPSSNVDGHQNWTVLKVLSARR